MDLYIQLRITDIIRETPDTFTYRFEVVSQADGEFDAAHQKPGTVLSKQEDADATHKSQADSVFDAAHQTLNTDDANGSQVDAAHQTNNTEQQEDRAANGSHVDDTHPVQPSKQLPIAASQDEGKPVPYKAGQFLTFIISLHGHEYRRSYSLCTTPGIDPFMAVTIKRITNGEISRHIHRTWKTGDLVKSLLPSGRFTLDSMPDMQRDIFLLGAGSGITPLFSLLQEALHRETSAHITLIYSNRNEQNTIFRQQILDLQQRFPDRFTILWLFSDPITVNGDYRRMNNSLLEMIAPKHLKYAREKAQFFVCGPSAYMRMVQFTLMFMGFSSAQLHKENFVVDTDARIARVQVPQDSSEKQVLIKHLGKEITFLSPGNETILHAAMRQGIELPYSCQGGVCGSCIARCAEGKVWMSVNEVLTDRELSQGLVLTCTGYAQSDVTLIW